jgi:hypothetical protein
MIVLRAHSRPSAAPPTHSTELMSFAPQRRSPASLSARTAALAGGLALALGAFGCGGGSSPSSGGSEPAGTLVPPTEFSYPAGMQGSPAGFFVEDNFGGSSTALQLIEMFWGRMVDVYDRDPLTGADTLRFVNFVIGEDIVTTENQWELETNVVTQAQTLTILHAFGTPAFDTALDLLDNGLGPIEKKGLSATEQPPFSFVARNAVLVLRFNDLLDPDTIDASTIRVLTGYPPVQPAETRILIDPNYGGIYGSPAEFRPTRVLIDPTVSEFEALTTNPPLGINAVGFPASTNTAQPNLALRIATQVSPATSQFQVLQNPTEHALLLGPNAPVDFASPSLDVVRAMRSGGPNAQTGDANNGYLFDDTPPRVIGSQLATLTNVLPDPQGGPEDFFATVTFANANCAQAPNEGDILQVATVIAQVNAIGLPPVNGVVNGVSLQLLQGTAPAFQAGGVGQYLAPFDAADDVGREGCFLTFFPSATAPIPNNVSPNAQITVRFSEPMAPDSVEALETIQIKRTNSATPTPYDIVVADLLTASNATSYTLTPILPFESTSGAATVDDYFLSVISNPNQIGQRGVTDLAGNKLAEVFPQVFFSIDPNAATVKNGSVVLRFGSLDELTALPVAPLGTGAGTPAGKPEIRGQVVPDLVRGVLRPRSVSRFSKVVDRTPQTVPSLMIPILADGTVGAGTVTQYLGGVREPLVRFGSRLMHVWRYCDLGLPVNNETFYNLDIERLYWSPLAGGVVADIYDQFEISLGHSGFFPDEFFDPSCPPTGAPGLISPNSGLVTSGFEDNVFSDPASQLKVVHPRTTPYILSPGAVELSPGTNTVVMPYPLNPKSANPSTYNYFTWRDTAITGVGAPNNLGIEPGIVTYALASQPSHTAGPPGPCGGNSSVLSGQVAPSGSIPSIGLPLLMDFKCFPTELGLGQNGLDASAAQLPAGAPIFRVFSSGGVAPGPINVLKNPDLQQAPTGGFNSNVAWGPVGAQTPGFDTGFYMGQVDFVVRVSRAHTHYLDTGVSSSPSIVHASPLILPAANTQPAGTSITLAFRGADALTPISALTNVALINAAGLDAYGDRPSTIAPHDTTTSYGPPANKNSLIAGITGWQNSVAGVTGKRYFQTRITFVSNTSSLQVAELSALGFAFSKP